MTDDTRKPFEIAFLKGLKSIPCRKTFKTIEAFDKWLDANGANVLVLASRDLEIAT